MERRTAVGGKPTCLLGKGRRVSEEDFDIGAPPREEGLNFAHLLRHIIATSSRFRRRFSRRRSSATTMTSRAAVDTLKTNTIVELAGIALTTCKVLLLDVYCARVWATILKPETEYNRAL